MKYIKAILGVTLLVLIDQLTKYWAATHLKGKEPIEILKNVFELNYLENQGAAFGIFQNQFTFLTIMTTIISVGLLFYFIKLPNDKRMNPMRIIIVFIWAGAIGNSIDRLSNQYVIDFLYFKLINFPIFNVADCYVTVSLFILAFLILFFYKDEELSWKASKEKNKL
ncbi:signal peptidase II [Anaeromicropila populeti]|uniref:Lipoprotein signal peptidase n=1 Tax=Anaeromicropila populeti TaxID=37658 RepID=A0A1I6L8F8_9FIRM|nr:signal peptidase II [Anaeromicropila populeti]SFR99749.1 signal peptidase II [Anaeromicropila populeti]